MTRQKSVCHIAQWPALRNGLLHEHNFVIEKNMMQGRPQDLRGGGAKNFFFRFGNLHVAKRHAAHGEAMRIAKGVRGHAPPRKFFKRCNLVRFRVYFDQILSLFFFKNYHFLYKK